MIVTKTIGNIKIYFQYFRVWLYFVHTGTQFFQGHALLIEDLTRVLMFYRIYQTSRGRGKEIKCEAW